MICHRDDLIFESRCERPAPDATGKEPCVSNSKPKLEYDRKKLFEYSLLIPGLGQFARGQIGRGFCFLFAALIAWGIVMVEIFVWEYKLSIVDLWPIGVAHILAALNAISPGPDQA
jgi:hypothetical protein